MKKKHTYLILCILWMMLIFWFSSQVGDDSQSMSDSVIVMIDRIFHTHILTGGGILEETVSFLVRKAAHMSEYAILAMLFAAYWRAAGNRHYLIMAFVCVVAYAASDEFHQLFVAGRSGQLKDVGIDTLGGTLGLLFQEAVYRIWMSRKIKVKKGS